MTGTARQPVTSLGAYKTGPARLDMLVRRMAGEDRDAFVRFYDAVLPQVATLIESLQPDPVRAEEAAAATFVAAWLHAAEQAASGTGVEEWIAGIATRAAAAADNVTPSSATSGHPSGELTLPMLLARRGDRGRGR
jgi:hypothetical protein